ncbi:Hypothetical protein POVR2_LOCUS110 [uncultured virus]|nr:Hypothetical protein POVR2_LOCUS110 [uncultured virus]
MNSTLLPLELLNEPFVLVDNGLRAELIEKRLKFNWSIPDMVTDIAKTTSNVSILNVYNTYGLQIAIEYVKYLLYISTEEIESWISSYIEDSYLHLGLKHSWSTKTVAQYSISIIKELRRLDSKNVYGLPTDACCNMPVELVARMIPSVRLSKRVTEQVWLLRARCPEMEDVATIFPYAVMQGNVYRCYVEQLGTDLFGMANNLCDIQLVTLYPDDVGTRRLEFSLVEDVNLCTLRDTKVAISLLDYRNYYADLGCNVSKHMNVFLDKLLARFSSVDSSNACDCSAWIVQLLADNEIVYDQGRSLSYSDMDKLLHELVTASRQLLRQDREMIDSSTTCSD